ncbi:MAG: [LysW]-lysine hydrolase [Halanaeroarchaeum sp.]
MTGRSLLRALVETPSVSGGEGAAAAVLADAFRAADREVFVDDVGNVRAPGDDALLLTSHVDTVPGEIPVRVEDGELWGRGAVDATGALAAMATAAIETGASFAGVVEEETTSRGARHLIEDRDPPDAVVNGEPGGWDGVVLGYRGFRAGTYAVERPAAHTSREDATAVERAIEWWPRVTAAVEGDGSAFESVTATAVGTEGGVSADGLRTEATVDAEFRLPPGTTGADLAATVASVTDEGDLAWDRAIPPVLESPRTPVARALRAGIRERGGAPTHLRKTGTSDMNLYAAAWDVPMATYGPGNADLDHAPDERLDLAGFDRAVDVLTHAADRLVG